MNNLERKALDSDVTDVFSTSVCLNRSRDEMKFFLFRFSGTCVRARHGADQAASSTEVAQNRLQPIGRVSTPTACVTNVACYKKYPCPKIDLSPEEDNDTW